MTQAVVLGGGIAGLLAAAAVRPHFDTVAIIERDALPDRPAHRPGTPQDKHVHALLAAGQQAIEALLPGFLNGLVVHDVPVTDFAATVAIRGPSGWGARLSSQLHAIGASRPLVEWSIRERLLRQPGVTILPRHLGDGLLGDTQRIRAVKLRTSHGPPLPPLDADLVIDATGRGSRADRWLTELGCSPPPVTRLDARVGYATRTFRIPEQHRADWHGCYLQPSPTSGGRGATLMPIEGGRWLISLIGVGAQRPTRDENDFLAFAQTLDSPVIADAIASAQPLTPVTVSTSTGNQRHHVERLHHAPDNLVRIGDAVCCFNPVYAQGMSTAALQAELLARCLNTRGTCRLAPRFHRELVSITRWPWTMATLADRRWPLAQGTPTTRMHRAALRYVDLIQTAGTHNPRVQLAFLNVFNLLDTPLVLAAPCTLIRLLRHERALNRSDLRPPPQHR
ncbi:NAD(P)/FAD-dependent oxidoreductase [Streptomyces sp. NPDC001404]|uniref:NAD(P)/FAD-dependent oxidoreductase n=1 Tax=Streptomyces sp. NPDC001404 TaxID=3364571 RepID=UPI003689E1D9